MPGSTLRRRVICHSFFLLYRLLGVDLRPRPELTKCAGLTHKPKNNNQNMFIDQDAVTHTRTMLANGENLLKSGFP